jgi:PleD family two-component response regulator
MNKMKEPYELDSMKSKIKSNPTNLTVKILIIDDDKVDRASLKRDLRNTHLVSQIVEAETGLIGIERFKQESFDCVLLDYYLPDKEGLEVLQELVGIGGEFITIIAITGTASETIPERMIGAGASDYLIKDEINTRILERVLRCVLKRKQLQEKYEEQLQELTKQLEISDKKLEKLAH